MAGKNPDETAVVDDDTEVTEDDLRDLKYGPDGVETSQEEDEPTGLDEGAEDSKEAGDDGEDKPTEDAEEGDEAEEDSAAEFVKEFPNIKGDTPEEYAKNLEIAYGHSFEELRRIRDEEVAKPATVAKEDDGGEEAPGTTQDLSPLELWAKQQLDKEITTAYADIVKKYPQALATSIEYPQFTRTVDALSRTIKQSEGRLASPGELYEMAANILKWSPEDVPDKSERIAAAAKDGAATSKSGSVTKPKSKSKVTDAMISTSRKMYPGKSDDEIRKELEPYVQ